jgi:DNA adenine methylase
MITDTTIKRPALRYFGGKWNLAPWIISYFPPHANYVEPCGGAASVLLQKTPSDLETFNDLDDRVINFFRVMREQPDELIRLLQFTPWSRSEFEYCQQDSDIPLEQARRFFVLCWQSISKPGGYWRSMYDYTPRPRSAPSDGIEIEHLYLVAERFKKVQIEHKDALEVIQQYDNANALIYFDPPYVASTRTNQKMYRYETDVEFHREAAEILDQAKGFVVVSGYESELYRDLYEQRGWHRFNSNSVATNGAKRIESLWLNPRAVQAQAQAQPLLFEVIA